MARKPARRAPKPRPWWGDDGDPPHLRWPGVTIEIPAIWVPITGVRKVTRDGHETGWTRDGKPIPTWWVEDGGRWEHPDGSFWFDRFKADHAVDFFPQLLRHHIGDFAGKPFELLDYQRCLLTRPIFGWKRTADALRRFRKLFGFLPKGAGKSPWLSGTGLYLTMSDGEAAAEVYVLANDKDQARVVFENAKIMVEESEDLLDEIGLDNIVKDSIYHAASRSIFKVVSAVATGKHGFRPHAVLFDEFHGQRNRSLYEAYKKSLPKRRQPIMLIVTHAGEDDEGICAEEYEGAKRVLSGTVSEPTFLPVVFEAKPDDDWRDPEVWRRVNPGHGILVQHEGIATECLEAQNEPRKLNDFKRYTLNIWVNQAVAWIPIERWDACKVESLDLDELVTLPCAAGIDMSQKIDLTACVVTFRRRLTLDEDPHELTVVADEGEGKDDPVERPRSLNYGIIVVPFFWIPEDTMREREKQDRVPYSVWANTPHPLVPSLRLVNATEGAMISYSRVTHDITRRIVPTFPRLRSSEFGYDPAFADDVATRLRDANFRTVEILQNYKHMSEVCYLYEGLLKAKRVRHDGNRVLRNHNENVAIKKDDAGRIRPVKPRNDTRRIDGVVGTLMGLKILDTQPDEDDAGSMYDTPDGGLGEEGLNALRF